MSVRGDSYTAAAKDAVRAAVDSEHDFGGWLAHVLGDAPSSRRREGRRGAAEVILDPPAEAMTATISEVLVWQRGWGPPWAERCLAGPHAAAAERRDDRPQPP